MWKEAENLGIEKYPNNVKDKIQYGTAGFRNKGSILSHIMYRMGTLAVLRSKLKKATIGVMITASHNPEEDNGIKLIDPLGEMLEQSWEGIASKLANTPDSELAKVLNEIAETCKIDLNNESSVFIGRDTRKTSPVLAQAVIDGINVAKGNFTDFGIVTTPQLHYNVFCKNSEGKYGVVGEKGYYTKLSNAFNSLRQKGLNNGNYKAALNLDGANGVGALKMKEMLPYLEKTLNLTIFNDGTGKDDVLNKNCGADFVKTQQKASRGLEGLKEERCVSFDGDADRVVYFFTDETGRFNLLDGDRIATLIASHFKEILSEAKLDDLNLGIVQTAYANGNSTNYITDNIKVPVECVSTGVKHLHKKALDFDIGVYFEANGHGTVVFSEKAHNQIKNAANESNNNAAKHLAALEDVINQTVGDSVADMLLVETILYYKGWSASDWLKSYTDLPNRLEKVKVPDRTIFQTTDAERKVLSPSGLQSEIDKIVSTYKSGRSFVRPSGTEDVVRVYAEADTQENANKLAKEVESKVTEFAA